MAHRKSEAASSRGCADVRKCQAAIPIGGASTYPPPKQSSEANMPSETTRPKGLQWIWWGWSEWDLFWGRCHGSLGKVYAWQIRLGPLAIRRWR